MAMPDLRKLRKAFRQHLYSQVDNEDLPEPTAFATENRDFIPPNPPSLWLREQLVQDSERKSATGMVESRGTWRLDVVARKGKGTSDVEELSKLIVEAFEPGTSMQHEDLHVAIVRSERRPGIEEDETWWYIPIFITWRFFAFTALA